MTPAEIKMDLQRKTLEQEVTIVGLHSIAVQDGVAFVIFDVRPDETGNGLYYEFPLPNLVSRGDLTLFGWWLAAPDCDVTVH